MKVDSADVAARVARSDSPSQLRPRDPWPAHHQPEYADEVWVTVPVQKSAHATEKFLSICHFLHVKLVLNVCICGQILI